ncbi:MAG: hypothetical protein M3501_08420 [Actinomycetota bacterium]|nr:hypothetical protein [Actinomycetota bacterium]
MLFTLAGTALLAACGDDDDAAGTEPERTEAATDSTTATSGDATTTPPASDDGYGNTPATTTASSGSTSAGGDATVATAETSAGTVLVDAEGFTLYGFMNDSEGETTCVDGCAEAWPPAFVDGEPTAGEGVDAAVLSTVEHPDGTMLKAGDWPLYRFAGDQAPGDVNGQGSGGVWFAVTPDGTLIEA